MHRGVFQRVRTVQQVVRRPPVRLEGGSERHTQQVSLFDVYRYLFSGDLRSLVRFASFWKKPAKLE